MNSCFFWHNSSGQSKGPTLFFNIFTDIQNIILLIMNAYSNFIICNQIEKKVLKLLDLKLQRVHLYFLGNNRYYMMSVILGCKTCKTNIFKRNALFFRTVTVAVVIFIAEQIRYREREVRGQRRDTKKCLAGRLSSVPRWH